MSQHEDHGNTPAAWTTVIALLIASLIAAAAVLTANIPLFIGGVVFGVLGVVAGKVLALAGFGKARGTSADADTASASVEV
jgi:hypothetical protein